MKGLFKLGTRGNLSLFIIAAVLLAVTSGLIVLQRSTPNSITQGNNGQTNSPPTATSNPSPTLKPIKAGGATMERMLQANAEKRNNPEESSSPTTDVISKVMEDNETKTTKLKGSIAGESSSGTAYLLREDGKIYLAVSARLPKPEIDNVYETWLVKNVESEEYFSTGVMLLQEEGRYLLEYHGDNIYPDYNTIIITSESNDDSKPERVIVEGKF